MSIAKDRSSCRRTISRALTTGMLGLALVFGVAVSQSHAQLYGNGADGSHTVVGTEHLTGHMNYVDLTVPPGAILETHGYEIRVTGFLINQGTITDSYSGGAGGPGGPGGDPTTGTGQNGTPGGTGVAGPSGAGTGGNGGGGGGAGGSARDFDDNKLALGGSGGDGGMGGKGGGRVRIFARHFNNLGVIHADGFSGQNGSLGQTGQYVTYTESVFFTRDLAGGGGGAGAGGHGGNGGTVTIVFETPTNFGTLSVQGGPPGGNSSGGNPINTTFPSGSSVQEYPGGLGATFDANGGDGGQGEVADLNSGSGGGSQPGAVGAPGVITLSQSNKCFPDADGDGYGDISSAGVDVVGACGPGASMNNYDCDDTQPTVNPAAPDIPDDGIDQDCDGVEAVTCYKDADNDGFGSPVGWVVTEGPCSSGYVSVGGDCDDGNNSIYPGATEIPNDGIDQDCDGFDAQLCYEDADGDGYGDPGSSMVSSGPCLVGWVVDNTDNCPFNFNPGQEDNNTDGVGNACCCVGVTGNVNGIGIVDLADLSLLVGYLTVPFPGKPVLPCPAEANVNAAGIIDLADLSMLVAYLTVPAPGKPALPSCP